MDGVATESDFHLFFLPFFPSRQSPPTCKFVLFQNSLRACFWWSYRFCHHGVQTLCPQGPRSRFSSHLPLVTGLRRNPPAVARPHPAVIALLPLPAPICPIIFIPFSAYSAGRCDTAWYSVDPQSICSSLQMTPTLTQFLFCSLLSVTQSFSVLVSLKNYSSVKLIKPCTLRVI